MLKPIIVTLHGGQSFFAELIGGDVQTDTWQWSGFLRTVFELQPAVLGDSSELSVGQTVLAIGYAFASFRGSRSSRTAL